MDLIIINLLSKLELGEVQAFNNMTLFPLLNPLNGTPAYLSMGEALGKGLLTVTEVNQGGTVPELKVVNRADLPVLLLAGEEVAGAKQNRVLNTTILLMEHSETIIPVSCTEQGRWDYVSEAFAESGHLMSLLAAQERWNIQVYFLDDFILAEEFVASMLSKYHAYRWLEMNGYEMYLIEGDI
jgi:hypothetical protein